MHRVGVGGDGKSAGTRTPAAIMRARLAHLPPIRAWSAAPTAAKDRVNLSAAISTMVWFSLLRARTGEWRVANGVRSLGAGPPFAIGHWPFASYHSTSNPVGTRNDEFRTNSKLCPGVSRNPGRRRVNSSSATANSSFASCDPTQKWMP